MNRPGKHCEVIAEAMPVARGAGDDETEDKSKLRKPAARPADIATRLLQLVSLVVLFVFGLIGASLVTLRHTGMSHPTLQRSTSLVASRLQARSELAASVRTICARYSPPVLFSLVALDQRDRVDEDSVQDVVMRFAPDFLVLDSPHTMKTVLSASGAPISYTCVGSSALSSVCFDGTVWSQDEHGVNTDESEYQCPWTLSWTRFARGVSLGRASTVQDQEWQSETLTVLSVSEASEQTPDAVSTCDLKTAINRLMDQLHVRYQEPFIITRIATSDVESALPEDAIDPFQYLHPHNRRNGEGSPRVLASKRLRPVGASLLNVTSTSNGSNSSRFAASIVFELIPPQPYNE